MVEPHDPWAPTERVPAYPPTTPYPYPGLAPSQPPAEPVILSIGEIQVTSTTIRTPVGEFPLRGSQWHISDSWTTEQKIPTWAIVLSIVGFFCLTIFSLLFLLAKETVYHGVVQVQVVNGPYHYVSRVPVNNQQYVQHVYGQVNYVRSLAAM
jgi:hypothetical protein